MGGRREVVAMVVVVESVEVVVVESEG